jgi:hypothetical protein
MSTSVRKGFVSVDSKFRFDAGSFSFFGLVLVLFVGGFCWVRIVIASALLRLFWRL